MRDIKFRFWNKLNKQMEYDNLKTNSYYQNPFTRSDLVAMQFTGLSDKNGKEIYEGDIIRSMPNDFEPEYSGCWSVIFSDGTFKADRTDDQGETWIPYWTEGQIEIIGNIYEHPDLLKGEL
jgi:uncharacterized phage protein (TIGR01671 family)